MPRVTRILLVLACAASLSACLDFGIDEEQYICRNQIECGDDYACLRGPGCYCVCKCNSADCGEPQGAQAEPNCDDPTCQNVLIQ